MNKLLVLLLLLFALQCCSFIKCSKSTRWDSDVIQVCKKLFCLCRDHSAAVTLPWHSMPNQIPSIFSNTLSTTWNHSALQRHSTTHRQSSDLGVASVSVPWPLQPHQGQNWLRTAVHWQCMAQIEQWLNCLVPVFCASGSIFPLGTLSKSSTYSCWFMSCFACIDVL